MPHTPHTPHTARHDRDGDGGEHRDEGFDPGQYNLMLELERLESLEEDLIELGLTTLAAVRQRIVELHTQLDKEE
jgi:hypothetical protein